MTSLINILTGTTQVIVELTRTQAGKELQPPVSSRTVQKYLDVASLYLEPFADFRDDEKGGLSPYAKITPWHLPVLQRIRHYVHTRGMKKLRIHLAQDPDYFLKGDTTQHEEQHRSANGERSSGKIQPAPQEAA